jgi:hypothetical protein
VSDDLMCLGCGTIGHITKDCPWNKATELEAALAKVTAERDKLKVEIAPYLEALKSCNQKYKDGYTIVDFQNVWLNQERERNISLKAEVEKLRARVTELEAEVKFQIEQRDAEYDMRHTIRARVSELEAGLRKAQYQYSNHFYPSMRWVYCVGCNSDIAFQRDKPNHDTPICKLDCWFASLLKGGAK